MRKTLTTALAAVTLAGGVLAAATPASAEHYSGNYRSHRGGSDRTAVAVAAGIAGLALGAALSSKSNGRNGYGSGYSSSYSSRSYPYSSNYSSRSYPYSNGYGYDPRDDSYGGDYYGGSGGYSSGYGNGYDNNYRRPQICVTRDRVYDPYIGRRVTIERQYAC